MSDARKLSAGEIDAIIAGCVGVTPGPWSARIKQDGLRHPKLTAFVTPRNKGTVIATLDHGGPGTRYAANADHIARLDPATVLALATLALESTRLKEALKALVDRLDLVHDDPQFRSVWTIAQLHGQPYGGLTYTNALEAARSALGKTETHSGTDK